MEQTKEHIMEMTKDIATLKQMHVQTTANVNNHISAMGEFTQQVALLITDHKVNSAVQEQTSKDCAEMKEA